MKVIITGTTGFVGRNLSKYLINLNCDVSTLSLRSEAWRNLLDLDSNVIIHLAGKAHDTLNTVKNDDYFRINRDLTIELFDRFLQSNIRDFFYFSSVKAVADTVDGILDEHVVGNPQTAYGQSKLAAEQYLLQQKLPEGKRLFIIRPCMIHGPGNKGNLNLLYQVVEKGIPWPLASFQNERSFLSIDNLCYLIDRMINRETLMSGIYNFSDDDTLSTNELVALIANTLDKKEKLWNISTSLIKNLVKIGDILPLPLNSERLRKLTESYVVSNAKIKIALNLEKLPQTAKEGLVRTIQSFQNRK